MTLIILLIGIVIEHFVGISDDIRRFGWFDRYSKSLESRLGQYKVWNGVNGVLITLAGPLLIVWFVSSILISLFYPLGLLFALAVLLYSLGPKYLDPFLDEYITALEEGDDVLAAELEQELISNGDSEQQGVQCVVENIFLQANERLFGVIFWFLVLGPLGALLFRLANLLKLQNLNFHGNYPDAARDLCDILNWPVIRLFALGNALSGHLVDALEAWRGADEFSLHVNETVLKKTGLGALQYRVRRATDDDSMEIESSYWIKSLQGLLNRTLIIWLIVLGLMTLAGWLK